MRFRPLLASGLLAFAACTPSAPAQPEPSGSASTAASEADLNGRWQIVSIDGEAVAAISGDRPGERSPHLVFASGSYGGSSGCNSFGGLGIFHGDRFYAGPAMQTAMGCGALSGQESAIIGLVTASPTVSPGAEGTLILSDGRRSLLLRRDRGSSPVPAPAEWSGTRILAGTHWRIDEVDGRRLAEGAARTLRFEADRWSLTGPCGSAGGQWRQQDNVIVARTADVSSACAPEAEAIDSAISALLSAEPAFATGPNGEILIGGGGHKAVGERPRSGLASDSALLAGSWRILAIDGAPPVPNSGSRIAFTRTGYEGSAGCNAFQGQYLAHARRFFSPHPIQTEMACIGIVADQEARVTAILAAAPAIGLAGPDELELVAETGRLRLRRDGPAEDAPEARLWDGEPLRAELTMLGGAPLQLRHSEPETRLSLSADRFDIESGCSRIGGIWRRSDGQLEFFTDAEPEPSGECAGALARRLHDFMRLFNGPARILIGASGELLIAGEHQGLAGRAARPARRR